MTDERLNALDVRERLDAFFGEPITLVDHGGAYLSAYTTADIRKLRDIGYKGNVNRIPSGSVDAILSAASGRGYCIEYIAI